MTRLLTLVVVLLAASTSQAKERVNCNEKAATMSGVDRSQFIAECVRRNASAEKSMPPMLARMSQCNREAGNMTGENRVRFVNNCLERHD